MAKTRRETQTHACLQFKKSQYGIGRGRISRTLPKQISQNKGSIGSDDKLGVALLLPPKYLALHFIYLFLLVIDSGLIFIFFFENFYMSTTQFIRKETGNSEQFQYPHTHKTIKRNLVVDVHKSE